MALTKYVTTAAVNLTQDVPATVVAGEPGTGGAAGFGNAATPSPGMGGKFGLFAGSFLPKGTVVMADSSAGTTGPQLLYQAIGAGNLRAYTAVQESGGIDGLSN